MSSGELLNVEPQELKFPFELKKQISCALQLSNKSDNCIAFNFKVKTTNPKKYCVRPNTGIVLPRTTCDVIVTMQAQRVLPLDMQCKDKFLFQCVIAPNGTTVKDITPEMFNKESGNLIEECVLRILKDGASSSKDGEEEVNAETKHASPTVSLKRPRDINQEKVGDSSEYQSLTISAGSDSLVSKHPKTHQSSSAIPFVFYREINDARIQMVETSLRILKDALRVCLSNTLRYRRILGAIDIFAEIINFNKHAKASFLDIIAVLDSLKVNVSDLLRSIDILNLNQIKERLAAEIPVLSAEEQGILDAKIRRLEILEKIFEECKILEKAILNKLKTDQAKLSERFKDHSQEVQHLFSGASVLFPNIQQFSVMISDLKQDIESSSPAPLSAEDIAKKAEEELSFSTKMYKRQIDQAVQNFLVKLEELDAHEVGEVSKK